jgi:hypothetical protein
MPILHTSTSQPGGLAVALSCTDLLEMSRHGEMFHTTSNDPLTSSFSTHKTTQLEGQDDHFDPRMSHATYTEVQCEY